MPSKRVFKALMCLCGGERNEDAGDTMGLETSAATSVPASPYGGRPALLTQPTASVPEPAASAERHAGESIPDTSAIVNHDPAGSPASTTNGGMASDAGKSQSLWDEAYANLDAELVDKYERLLSRELPATGVTAIAETPKDQGEETLNKTPNRMSPNPEDRRGQLLEISTRGQDMASSSGKYHFAGHEFDLRDQVAQATKLVQWGKALIDDAVKVSPEASLAWCGVCLVLPLLTIPSDAENSHREGFAYVSGRMRYYLGIERHLFPKNLQRPGGQENPGEAFRKTILELYQHILEYQLKSVLRFFRHWLKNAGKDLIEMNAWPGMLTKITDCEKILGTDFEKINDIALRENLEDLNQSSIHSLETLQGLLLVAEKQLSVAKDQLSVAKEQLEALKALEKSNERLGDMDNAPISLPTVDEARYNSANVQKEAKCHKNTRTGFRTRIASWANDATGEPLLWISGPAGTGKSTLALTLTAMFEAQGQLAAGYFFKRGESRDRNDITKLFPTIASQLVVSIPSFEAALRKSLNRQDIVQIEKLSLEEQFNRLLLKPLAALTASSPPTPIRIIVVDALDECRDYDEFGTLINLLARLRGPYTVRLRAMLTSRSSTHIVQAFEGLEHRHDYRRVELEKEFRNESKQDMSSFLRERFQGIKSSRKITKTPWPKETDLDTLVDAATNPSALFIYAATLFLFVDDPKKRKSPETQLELWLSQCGKNVSQLDQTYTPILRQVISGIDDDTGKEDPLDPQDRSNVLQILGSIILVATPVSASVLSILLGLDLDRVTHWLRNLHAILDFTDDNQTPIRLLHKSFSDFIFEKDERKTGTSTSPANTSGKQQTLSEPETEPNPFQINTKDIHKSLTTRCLQLMKTRLRHDQTESLQDDADTQNTRAAVQYACVNWVYHMEECGQESTDFQAVFDFLQEYRLEWVDTLIALGKTTEAISQFAKIGKMFSELSATFPIQDLLSDTRTLSLSSSAFRSFPILAFTLESIQRYSKKPKYNELIPQVQQLRHVISSQQAQLQLMFGELDPFAWTSKNIRSHLRQVLRRPDDEVSVDLTLHILSDMGYTAAKAMETLGVSSYGLPKDMDVSGAEPQAKWETVVRSFRRNSRRLFPDLHRLSEQNDLLSELVQRGNLSPAGRLPHHGRIRKNLQLVLQAIFEAARDCDCTDHRFKLQVDWLLYPEASPIEFKFLFSAPKGGLEEWHSVLVRLQEPGTIQLSHVELTSCPWTYTHNTELDSLAVLPPLQLSSRSERLLLQKQHIGSSPTCIRTVPLRSILGKQVTAGVDEVLTRERIFGIVAAISEGFLCVSSTSWLANDWLRKIDITLLSDDTGKQGNGSLVWGSPTVTYHFPPSGEEMGANPCRAGDAPTFRIVDQELLDLCILLAELGLRKPFDVLASGRNTDRYPASSGGAASSSQFDDLRVLHSLSVDLFERVGPEYAGAVYYCMRLSEDPRWIAYKGQYDYMLWKEYMSKVVEPIRDYWRMVATLCGRSGFGRSTPERLGSFQTKDAFF